MNNKSGTHFSTSHPSEGFWTIGESLHIHVKEKPEDSQIKATEELLGWKWSDE